MSNWHIMCMPACIKYATLLSILLHQNLQKHSRNSYACNKTLSGSVEMHDRVVGVIKLIIDDAITIAIHE